MSSVTKVTDPLAGAPAPTGGWREGIVREVTHPTTHGVALRLEVPQRVDHLPGQHYVIRLTADDGYTAQRSYSLASAPSDPLLEFFVERLDDGEVSTYLADVVQPGDTLQIRGPLGGWFVWRANSAAVGVAGGSGVVPFIAMMRHAAHLGRADLFGLVVSARTLADIPYADELRAYRAGIVLTRQDLPDRVRGRLAAMDLSTFGTLQDTTCFVCGSAGFAEAASTLLVGLGVSTGCVRVERFGPSGA